jgi:hypothetical protein
MHLKHHRDIAAEQCQHHKTSHEETELKLVVNDECMSAFHLCSHRRTARTEQLNDALKGERLPPLLRGVLTDESIVPLLELTHHVDGHPIGKFNIPLSNEATDPLRVDVGKHIQRHSLLVSHEAPSSTANSPARVRAETKLIHPERKPLTNELLVDPPNSLKIGLNKEVRRRDDRLLHSFLNSATGLTTK